MPELIDIQAVRKSVERLARELTADPKPGQVSPKVMTKLLNNVTSESRFSQYEKSFTLLCDEAIERAGRGEHPSPMRYFLSGIAFCIQVWVAKAAALADCPLQTLEIDLQAFLDMRGEHLVGGVPPHPQYIVMDMRVTSASPAEVIQRVADDGVKRCPLSSLVTRAIPIHQRVFLNGKEIRNSVPTGAA